MLSTLQEGSIASANDMHGLHADFRFREHRLPIVMTGSQNERRPEMDRHMNAPVDDRQEPRRVDESLYAMPDHDSESSEESEIDFQLIFNPENASCTPVGTPVASFCGAERTSTNAAQLHNFLPTTFSTQTAHNGQAQNATGYVEARNLVEHRETNNNWQNYCDMNWETGTQDFGILPLTETNRREPTNYTNGLPHAQVHPLQPPAPFYYDMVNASQTQQSHYPPNAHSQRYCDTSGHPYNTGQCPPVFRNPASTNAQYHYDGFSHQNQISHQHVPYNSDVYSIRQPYPSHISNQMVSPGNPPLIDYVPTTGNPPTPVVQVSPSPHGPVSPTVTVNPSVSHRPIFINCNVYDSSLSPKTPSNNPSMDSDVFESRQDSLPQSEYSSLVISADNLPPSNNRYWDDDFIPREKDQTGEILGKISQKSPVQVFCISGGPGNGKTTFAKHVGEEALNRGVVHAVYFTSFETIFEEPGVVASLGAVAIEKDAAKCKNLAANAILKGFSDKNFEDPPRALEGFCRKISKDSRVLFILDNVETMSDPVAKEAFCGIMRSMFDHRSRNVHLLLTTRDAGVCNDVIARLQPPTKIVLDTFNETESHKFLLKFIGPAKERLIPENYKNHVRLILENCQGNALGLKLSASIMNEHIGDDSPKDFFVKSFDTINSVSDDYLRNIIRCSYDRLRDEEKQFLVALSAFPGPFTAVHAKQVYRAGNTTDLIRLKNKSLISRHDKEDNKYNIHPFIRDFCRKLPDYGRYRLKFIEITLKNLVAISTKAHLKSSFSSARSEFLSDSLHFESALALIDDEDDGIDGELKAELLRILQEFAVPQEFSSVLNFLSHVFYSSQVDLLNGFIEKLIKRIPKVQGHGLDIHVIVKSHFIRGHDFYKEESISDWTKEAEGDLEFASDFAKGHYQYSRGLYVAKTTFSRKKSQQKATEGFEKAASLMKNADKLDAEMLIVHYSRMSIAIQKTKCRDPKSVEAGKNELNDLLLEVKEKWGTNPIVMEVEKSLADLCFTVGTRKKSSRNNIQTGRRDKRDNGKQSKIVESKKREEMRLTEESREAFREANRHYAAAYDMMIKLDINQEQSRVRLLRNRASCMLYIHIPGEGSEREDALNEVDRLYQVAHRLIYQCQLSALRYEVECAIAVFYECWALTQRDPEDKLKKAKEHANEAKHLVEKLEKAEIKLIKGGDKELNNINAIINGLRSPAALDLFPELKRNVSTDTASLTSLDGIFNSGEQQPLSQQQQQNRE